LSSALLFSASTGNVNYYEQNSTFTTSWGAKKRNEII
jgi:hypothetical protein